ncbi:MAG: hypothetical protein AB4352_06845 [Hormoscilla sp.]
MATVIAIVSFSSLPSPAPSSEKLRMLGSSFSGYSTFRYYPQFQKKLEEVQLALSYRNVFDRQEIIELFNRGEADLIAMTLDQFLRQTPDGKIVGMIDRSVGADGAVLNTKQYPSVTTLEKLRSLAEQEKGKKQPLKVVYAADSPSEFFLVLINNSFNAFNQLFENLEASDDRDAWKRLQVEPEVALAILREPYLTIAEQNGYKKVDFSTEGQPKKIIDVIVASNRLLQNKPEAVSKFLTAYYDYIISPVLDESLIGAQIFSESELSPEAAAKVGQGIHFFTAIEANYWLTEGGKLEKQIEAIASLLSQAGLLDRKPQNPQDLFTAQYLEDAVAETNDFCDRLGNVPQFQKFKQRVCVPK